MCQAFPDMIIPGMRAIDGKRVTLDVLRRENAEDEEFLEWLEDLEVGEKRMWGLPAGWGAATFEIERVR